MSTPPRLSADGLYYWDGRQWVSALSPDGRSRWDGLRWVPVQQPAAPPPMYAPMYVAPPAPAPKRVPTSWTRPLQYAVGAAFAVYGLYTISTPLWLGEPMRQYMRQIALQQAQQAPEVYADPNQYADTMSNVMNVGLAIGVVLGLAVAAVVLIGTYRRWTWMFYAVLVLLGLQVLGLPLQIVSALGLMTTTLPAFGMPAAASWVGVAFGLVAGALVAWMLVALFTRGPWAMRKALPG